jgi:hypothetical protein
MSRTPIESLMYLLDVVNSIGYAILLVVLVICLRWLLAMVEGSTVPRKTSHHRFVHPFPSQPESKRLAHDMSLDAPGATEEADSTNGYAAHCGSVLVRE